MKNYIKHNELNNSSLKPGFIYKGGNLGNISDDPFNALLHVGNAAGMRPKKNKDGRLAYIVLITNPSNHTDYPDELHEESNILTYFGDQKIPNKSYLDTKQKGNFNIENLYHEFHSKKPNLNYLYPCFYFEKIGSTGRDYKFHGIAYPFVEDTKLSDVCRLVTSQSDSGTIENLKFSFSLDTTNEVTRAWLADLISGNNNTSNAPTSWKNFLSIAGY